MLLSVHLNYLTSENGFVHWKVLATDSEGEVGQLIRQSHGSEVIHYFISPDFLWKRWLWQGIFESYEESVEIECNFDLERQDEVHCDRVGTCEVCEIRITVRAALDIEELEFFDWFGIQNGCNRDSIVIEDAQVEYGEGGIVSSHRNQRLLHVVDVVDLDWTQFQVPEWKR